MRDRTKLVLISSLMALVACGGSDEGPYPLDPPSEPSAPAPAPAPDTVPPPYPVPGGGIGKAAPSPSPGPNQAPVANAGPDQKGADGEAFQLDGSASTDPDGDPKTYAWSFVSKPTGSVATLDDATAEKPTFTADVIGDYKLQLEVRDDKGLISTDDVTVSVTGPALAVVSTGFVDANGIIQNAFVGASGGEDQSPPLTISNVPTGTTLFAIVMDDEIAPCGKGLGACRHWAVLNIPKGKTSIVIDEDWSTYAGVALGEPYGTPYNLKTGYAGPNPPNQHTYNLTVYALGAGAPVKAANPVPQITRASFEAEYKNYILAKATLTGKYPAN